MNFAGGGDIVLYVAGPALAALGGGDIVLHVAGPVLAALGGEIVLYVAGPVLAALGGDEIVLHVAGPALAALGGDDIAFYVVVTRATKLKCLVPRRQHYEDGNHLHFLTASTYRRARVFDSDRCKLKFVRTLGDLRAELGFRIVGYVLMPEHCHLLIWPAETATLSQIMQKLSERTANFVIRLLSRNRTRPWCEKMLRRLELPPTIHHHAHHRVWQRGGYDLNIWSKKKRQEKLIYMHNNPVKRGLAATPGDWPWSSWRFYYLQDSSILAMDRMP